MVHDQRLKTLIKLCFREFLELFFATWAARFDFDEVEFLDQEVYPNPPEGDLHLMDVVAKVKTREPVPLGGGVHRDQLLALIHLEIESPDKTTLLRPRFKDYYLDLRREYGLPVLPIALYLKVGLDGIGVDVYTESFWELETLRIQYLYVGLPALDAVEYLHQENPLGWALISLMKIPKNRIQELGVEAFERIIGSSLSAQKKHLLAECLDAYLPVKRKGREAFHRLLLASSDSGVRAMGKTLFEKLREEGQQEERLTSLQNYRQTLVRLIEKRFGKLSSKLQKRINSASWDELTQLFDRILDVASANELLS